MNDATFGGAHRAKKEGKAGRTDTVGGVTSHRAKLRFTNRAKAVNVADKALAFGKFARKRLIDKVFQRIEEFAAFAAHHRRIGALDVQDTAALTFTGLSAQLKSGHAKDVVQELFCLSVSFLHLSPETGKLFLTNSLRLRRARVIQVLFRARRAGAVLLLRWLLFVIFRLEHAVNQ